ncbi:MAG: hypothetical protein O2960_18805 [Verrucomicrobia bacterium]|nr:hypothetical protein [Verrucomicrobiota bacterium]
MTIDEIATALTILGCPKEKSIEMASQLDKRARQISVETGRSYDAALLHLLDLMKHGWAAQQKGIR